MGQHFSAKLKYHAKIVAGSAALALLVALFNGEEPVAEIFLICFLLLWSQLEIFLWMAPKFLRFRAGLGKKDFIRSSINKLVFFYFAVLGIALSSSFLGLSAFFFFKGDDLQAHWRYFIGQGAKTFLKYYVAGLFLGTVSYFYFQWKDSLEREQRLRQEKLLFQFETLKSQVNSHFLFNSLNTLSSLIGISAQRADEFVQKLSSIYQYILEYREIECIDLALEIDFVRDYFYLQQIRDGDKIDLSIEISDPQNYRILPISLQLLVENALKHNSATTGRPLKITIYAENGFVVVRNNLQRKSVLENSKKTGLNNLRERIRYSLEREMKVLETRDEFKVMVPLISRNDNFNR